MDMELLPLVMLAGGALLVLLMIVFAFSGPNEAKAGNKRLSAIKDRHANSTGAVVEAQMRRIQQSRATRDEWMGQIAWRSQCSLWTHWGRIAP